MPFQGSPDCCSGFGFKKGFPDCDSHFRSSLDPVSCGSPNDKIFAAVRYPLARVVAGNLLGQLKMPKANSQSSKPPKPARPKICGRSIGKALDPVWDEKKKQIWRTLPCV